MARFGTLEIPDWEARRLSDSAIVERLIAEGKSRLTAYRIVELGREQAERGCEQVEPGRARAHAQSRR